MQKDRVIRLQSRTRPAAIRADLSADFGIEGVVQHDQLLATLSEFLTVERGSIQLYTLALERSTDADIRGVIRDSLRDTAHHVELLESAIRELGGDPNQLSESAKVQEQRTQALLKLDADPSVQEMADLENLMIGETKCHMDWEFLRAMTRYIDDPQALDVVNRMLAEVANEAFDGQIHWAKSALTTLMLKQLVRPKEQSQAA